MDDVEERSTDGSDRGSDLDDFLVGSEDEEANDVHKVSSDDEATEAKTLVDEFPYDRSLLNEDGTVGPRRSKRARRSVQRYRDPDYHKLMLDDVDENDLKSDGEGHDADESDGDFDVSAVAADDDDDADDESEYSDEEEEE